VQDKELRYEEEELPLHPHLTISKARVPYRNERLDAKLCFAYVEGEVSGVFSYTDQFVSAAVIRLRAEVLANRIFVLEELSRKRFIDDCYFSRTRELAVSSSELPRPLNDGSPGDIKVSRRNSIPRSRVVIFRPRSRMSVHPNASTPTVTHRRVLTESDGRYARNACFSKGFLRPNAGSLFMAIQRLQRDGLISHPVCQEEWLISRTKY